MKGKSNSFRNITYPGRANGGYYDFKNNIHPHSLPIKHIPNSHIEQKDDNGKTIRIRYYDDKGNVYKDVDYTNHNNPEKHPKVPHTHYIEIIDDKIHRKKGVRGRVS